MPEPVYIILAAGGAFVLGSLPWGLWIGRLARGVDIRQHGSGNLGATNVYRTLGPGWGITVLLLDALKGVAAVLLARALTGLGMEVAASSTDAVAGAASTPGGQSSVWVELLAMAVAVLGHSFSPFAAFRGGKGVATAAGAWGTVAPMATASALAVFAIVFALTRIVSAGSMAAAIALPLTLLLLPGGDGPLRGPRFWAAVLTALLIIVRHRANIARLRSGRERRLDLRGGRRDSTASGEGDPPGGTATREDRQ